MIDVHSMLKMCNLKRTPFRVNLLELFVQTKSSIQTHTIRETFEGRFNKATIYRAIEAFEKNGLIHKVPDINNVLRYALCRENCVNGSHKHTHSHLICNSCRETYCIDQITTPNIPSAIGLKIDYVDLVLNGECFSCQLN